MLVKARSAIESIEDNHVNFNSLGISGIALVMYGMHITFSPSPFNQGMVGV